MNRIFLLSPARSNGRRAQLLLRSGAQFELARQLQIRAATLADVFSFCSGLYFRGKIAYARRFGPPSPMSPGAIHIITPTRGLLPPDAMMGMEELREFAEAAVDAEEPRYAEPLRAAIGALSETDAAEVVLLGSIATAKYVGVLLPLLGERLLFPTEFVGRGDMSRGALLLRRAASGEELAYTPVQGATRTGRRPSRITPKPPGH